MTDGTSSAVDAATIRKLIENCARVAVRAKNWNGILAHHFDDILMFDVPPHWSHGESLHIERHGTFFILYNPNLLASTFKHMEIVTGSDAAFVTALRQCSEMGVCGELRKLDFRLTVGLRKIDSRWTAFHGHHSVPAKGVTASKLRRPDPSLQLARHSWAIPRSRDRVKSNVGQHNTNRTVGVKYENLPNKCLCR